jgi:hypothetical protein
VRGPGGRRANPSLKSAASNAPNADCEQDTPQPHRPAASRLPPPPIKDPPQIPILSWSLSAYGGNEWRIASDDNDVVVEISFRDKAIVEVVRRTVHFIISSCFHCFTCFRYDSFLLGSEMAVPPLGHIGLWRRLSDPQWKTSRCQNASQIVFVPAVGCSKACSHSREPTLNTTAMPNLEGGMTRIVAC